MMNNLLLALLQLQDSDVATLLQYGALGVMTLGSVTISTILWKRTLALQDQIDALHRQSVDRYEGIIGRYESIIRDLLAQQAKLDSTLESLQEGLAAKDLTAQILKRLERN